MRSYLEYIDIGLLVTGYLVNSASEEHPVYS
jgi:hypothetical protein